MITKQQLQQILNDFEQHSTHSSSFLCLDNDDFALLWTNSGFRRLCYSKAEEFLVHDYDGWFTGEERTETDILFWREDGVVGSHRDIRIDFLNWWINNF
jgi:hypothetical protein